MIGLVPCFSGTSEVEALEGKVAPHSWTPKTGQGLEEASGGEKWEAVTWIGGPGGQRSPGPVGRKGELVEVTALLVISELLSGQGIPHLENKKLWGSSALSPVGSEGWASLPSAPTGDAVLGFLGPRQAPTMLAPALCTQEAQPGLPTLAPMSRLLAWREVLGSPERTEE